VTLNNPFLVNGTSLLNKGLQVIFGPFVAFIKKQVRRVKLKLLSAFLTNYMLRLKQAKLSPLNTRSTLVTGEYTDHTDRVMRLIQKTQSHDSRVRKPFWVKEIKARLYREREVVKL
jgi:fructose-1,6-bisphosphatase